jgi:sortase B
MKNGSMFKTLHKYKDKKFFSENSEIFIYMEGKILRYKIFAAYLYDDRHLLKSFDFNDKNIFRIYLNNVLTNKKMSSNMDMMVKVSENDRIITLSTCDARDNQRYLVQAVLLSIQESPQE